MQTGLGPRVPNVSTAADCPGQTRVFLLYLQYVDVVYVLRPSPTGAATFPAKAFYFPSAGNS